MITPNKTWNSPTVEAWLAVTRPKPNNAPPASTTARVPNRSESAPQKKEAGPMHKKLSSAAVEMLVRDQPVATDMGRRKMPSDIIVPSPRQVMTRPAPTMIHP
jgi:hypothetical protein